MEMVQGAQVTFIYDYWANVNDESIWLNCLMPNGIFIPLYAKKWFTFNEVKEDLWEESASKYPLHGLLHDSSSYRFVFININAELEELFDENKRLCDVKPFGATLKIIEKQNDKAENVFNVQIGRLIGKGLHEFDTLKNTEVNIFRSKMKTLADKISQERKNYSWTQKMIYQFPPTLIFIPVDQQMKSQHSPIPKKLRDGNFVVVIKFENNDSTFTFNVPVASTSDHLMRLILNKRATNFLKKNENIADFVLKVCGQEEYIYGNHRLIEYAYIYESLRQNKTPTLIVISVYSVPLHPDDHLYEIPENLDLNRINSLFSTGTQRKKGKIVSSYNIEDKFAFRVCFLTNLNINSTEVSIQTGLFHGGKPLCESMSINDMLVKDGRCNWEVDLEFDIKVGDIPRMAKICFTLYENCKSVKSVRSKRFRDGPNQDFVINPLGWVNTTVFDYKGHLRSGSVTLYLWTHPEELQSERQFHSLSTVVSNPDSKNTAALTISFHKLHDDTIMYPQIEDIVKFAKENRTSDLPESASSNSLATSNLLEHVRSISDHVTRYEFHEHEKRSLWTLRYQLMTSDPHLLSKLLDCVDWNNRYEVSEAISLLQEWPPLDPQKAIELLDYAYADLSVRSYAVRCLRALKDDHLLLYLLQLVQALKHECYLQNDLVKFLLKKSLNNQKIGHYLFWHLRSEMKDKSVSVRFGLILEAYCRGSPEHVKVLIRQIGFLDKLKTTNELIRKRKDKEKIRSFVQDYFQESHCTDAFYLVCNPLDPSFKCKRVKVEKCRVMDSKAKPLWLVFENDDVFGEDIHIIFKNGDDLRQDMLTLQMLRIMDNLWKIHGFDFRMNSYGCISTDSRIGLIEVVLNAETIANIQKEKGIFSATSAFRKGSILAWLKEHNTSEQELNKAIEEFTYSCAGYCVATFVLGIADRHSDNIMVKKTGQLFHIDFGHILGHFKEKFGFRRERVPFVLTHDFVHVINKGQSKGEVMEFQAFQRLCNDAFLILRKHGSLILSLFAMMISTGLPELSSENDLNYLHDSLVLHLSDKEAEEYFEAKFQEALSNSWKTSLNWASHNVSKNNRV